MAGNKLQGELKVACDAVYKSDPVRFKRLIEWVYRMQRLGWTDLVLAEVLRMFYPQREQANDWWKYLTSLLTKAHARCEEKESEGYKKGDLTKVSAVLKKAFGFRK